MIERAFRTRARKCHPDTGGSNEAMVELNTARDQALKEIAGPY
jgi:curved DNA-binding protein CbpA